MKNLLILVLTAPFVAGATAQPPGPGEPAGSGAATTATEGLSPAEAAPKKLVTVATRFIAEEQGDYIKLLRQKLAINKRSRGPFGLFQDPGKTPIVMPTRERRKVVETPFSEFIRAIRVSAIFAADKEFLVGSRIFRVGQIFPLVAGGQTIKVRIESVKPTSVTFRNLTSNELAAKRLDLLPAGVQASNGSGITPDGVTSRRASEAQPLHLDLLSPPPTP